MSDNSSGAPAAQTRKAYMACRVGDIAPGERLITVLNGKSIGLFNIEGKFFALHNRCPHVGGNLCQGPLTGTTLPSTNRQFVYGYEGRILRCAWHGWEFEVETGQCLADPKLKARTYPVTVEGDAVMVHL